MSFNQKAIIFPISQRKHTLWVLVRSTCVPQGTYNMLSSRNKKTFLTGYFLLIRAMFTVTHIIILYLP